MEIKEISHEFPSKECLWSEVKNALLRRTDARRSADIIYAYFTDIAIFVVSRARRDN